MVAGQENLSLDSGRDDNGRIRPQAIGLGERASDDDAEVIALRQPLAFVRQAANAHRIEQLENRGVRPNPERQRNNRHQRESRIKQQQAEAVTEILP